MTKAIILIIFIFTLFYSTNSVGQTKPQKKKHFTYEAGMSATYNLSNELIPKIHLLLLYKNNLDFKSSPKSGLLYGIGISGIYDNRIKNGFYISSSLEYFNGFFELDGKMHISLYNSYYYFEPQIGINFCKHNKVLLLGYNLSLDRKSPAHDIVGVTLTLNYRMTYKK